MVRSHFLNVLALCCFGALLPAQVQRSTADPAEGQKALDQGLALADLYNWATAAPSFEQALSLFDRSGDRRNALYARLGLTRANIERQQETLPAVSNDLAIEIADNPLLQSDKRLRLFALVVKGDIDAETDLAAMRQDWQQVQALAQELDDAKWGYRSLAQLGVVAFYDGDTETARKSAGAALAAASAAGDVGAQIRVLTILGHGLVATRAYEQAVPLLEKALQIASAVPASGYQFPAQEARLAALIGLKQFGKAEQIASEVLDASRRQGRAAHEATVLGLSAQLELARGEPSKALVTLQTAIGKAEEIGLLRAIAQLHATAAEINRQVANLPLAEDHLLKSALAAQRSGDVWTVPQRLQMLAEIQTARGQYKEASETFEKAEVFVDAMIGKASTVLEKAAFIRATSDIYSKHFSLVADHFKDPARAYAIVEQVRGRIAVDQLLAGTSALPGAASTERAIARLRLTLMQARSTEEVKRLRDEIFLVEQARWVSPGVSILKRQSASLADLELVRRSLSPATVVLEYVLSEPSSYCLVITRAEVRLVTLTGSRRLEELASSYLVKAKAKQASSLEATDLHRALIKPLNLRKNPRLIVVRDGLLHLLPFEAFMQDDRRYLAQTAVVSYAPSVTSFYLLSQEKSLDRRTALLGVGGVGYANSRMNTTGIARGDVRRCFAELPSSREELMAAANTLEGPGNLLLMGHEATETAFKRSDPSKFGFIHLAVHGFADRSSPERAALVLLSDAENGEDGFLYSSEVVQLVLASELVVLSACETAVGPLQGQEGISTLSRAFLLAGAKSVVSTLWQADDVSSSFLMKRFYSHLANKRRPADALTAAKRDVLIKFGSRALPYHWAGFVIEGGTPHGRVHSRRKGDVVN